MKFIHLTAAAVSLAVLVASAPAQAQRGGHFRGGVHFGIGIGVPFYGYRPYYPPYYYPPYYYPPAYYPPVVVAPAAPPVYIERQDQLPPQPQVQADAGQNDWFYCPDSKTYYPYVQQCASEWQRVTPHPPAK
jgi:hypothetical protein